MAMSERSGVAILFDDEAVLVLFDERTDLGHEEIPDPQKSAAAARPVDRGLRARRDRNCDRDHADRGVVASLDHRAGTCSASGVLLLQRSTTS